MPQMEHEMGAANLFLSHWLWMPCSSYSMTIDGISKDNFNYVCGGDVFALYTLVSMFSVINTENSTRRGLYCKKQLLLICRKSTGFRYCLIQGFTVSSGTQLLFLMLLSAPGPSASAHTSDHHKVAASSARACIYILWSLTPK